MKKRTLTLLLTALIYGSLLLGISGCSATKSWNISDDESSSVQASLIEGKNSEYTLSINGKGNMKSFTSKEETPWSKNISKITKVKIYDGVKTIGSYAFSGIDVDSIILPQSMEMVHSYAVDDDVSLFAKSRNVKRDEDLNAKIYNYLEDAPKSDNVYWQSDFSTSDIVGNNVPEEDKGLYWHYNNDGVEEIFEKVKILFVGNSFTYRNGCVDFSSGVPGIFDKIAEDLGYWVDTYSITGPGWYLENHAKASDTCGKQIDKLLNTYNDFDYVVLQEQSVNPFENYTRFLNGVKALQQKIEKTQEDAKIYLYETWGSPYSADERNITVAQMEAKLLKAYNDAAEECGLDVSYVGQAFTHVYDNYKQINLYDTDNRHQGYTGAYLSASVHVGTILGGDVRETTFVNEEKFKAPVLSDSVLEILRNTAYKAAFERDELGNNENITQPDKPDYSLEIAVWGRWITEVQFASFYDSFKSYLQSNSIDYSNIHYTYYVGATTSDPYYYIANFTGAVVGGGGADIIFPCATNLTTQTGSQITNADIAPLNVTLNGSTNRCVAKLTDKELANAFYNYCLSTEGKALLSSLSN